MVTAALAAAREEKPDFSTQNLTLDFSGGLQGVALNGPSGRQAARISYDPASGTATYTLPPPSSIRGVVIGLHTGKIGGTVGLVLVMLAGIILSVLSVTGFIVYFDMWTRRRKAGKIGLFW